MYNQYLKKILVEIAILPLWKLLDIIISKKDNYWGFPVHFIKTDQFVENTRAVFENCKKDIKIKKIIFVRLKQNHLNIEGATNTKIIKISSLLGLWMLIRCKVLFLSNGISFDYSLRWGKIFSIIKLSSRKRIIINLWHGIPLKRLFALANKKVRNRTERVSYRIKERKLYSGLIASSKIDSYAMAAMFYPIKHENLWITGLPRNDFLLKKIDELPNYLKIEIDTIRQIKNKKLLITYAPTYRQNINNAIYYQFQPKEIEELKGLLIKHNAIFGFRMHYFRNQDKLFNLEKSIDNELIFDLGHNRFTEIAPVIRESDLVITDYSSVFIDSLYLNKPVFSFAYDFESYKTQQDGLLYDLGIVFPGPVVQNFQTLVAKLDEELTLKNQVNSIEYRIAQKFFFEYIDENNTERVINKVKELLSK